MNKIPAKSRNFLLENLKLQFSKIFDFELSHEKIDQIRTLDRNESQFFDHRDPAAVQNIHDLIRHVD